jgi:nicotinate-nucleotide--dimethylbenzimidazole phosphoribosyltransferase
MFPSRPARSPTSFAGRQVSVVPKISPIDGSVTADLKARLDAKAKPVGALGRLEDLALQIALITETATPRLGEARLIIFAGDHGLTAEGVTAYPSAVSGLIAQLVLDGRAGANITARQSGTTVLVVDAGLLQPLPPHPLLIERRMAAGTANSRRESAMSEAQRDVALAAGVAVAHAEIDAGVDLLALGEIGIGNSSAAALLAHAVTGIPLTTLVGPGAGAPPGGIAHKLAMVAAAYARAPTGDAGTALAEFAGFEMVMLAGAMLGAASRNRIVLVDGFIATAVAAAVVALAPNARDRPYR